MTDSGIDGLLLCHQVVEREQQRVRPDVVPALREGSQRGADFMAAQPTAEMTTDHTGLTLRVEHAAPLLGLAPLNIGQVEIHAQCLRG
ncbi:hypothetical protein [Streptomyces sp. NPDC059631]|uniref:hypothetical protein n=1 Tax=unclassified Streptomyces TaxID=2593676 RepID=UPI0036A48985